MSRGTKFFNQINAETEVFENLSKYVTSNELNQYAKKQGNSLIFFHLNISLLPHHLTELHNLLTFTDVKFDAIGITESKLNHNKTISQLLISQITIKSISLLMEKLKHF